MTSPKQQPEAHIGGSVAPAASAPPRRRPVSRFKLLRVERADMPEGSRGSNWYRYVLENGRSTITGRRRGSLKDVTAYATRYAEQLNARAASASYSIWAPRSSKK